MTSAVIERTYGIILHVAYTVVAAVKVKKMPKLLRIQVVERGLRFGFAVPTTDQVTPIIEEIMCIVPNARGGHITRHDFV